MMNYRSGADNLKQQLQDRISSNTGQQKPRLIVEGFPVTLSESQAFEKEVGLLRDYHTHFVLIIFGFRSFGSSL